MNMEFPLELVYLVVRYLVLDSRSASEEKGVNIKPPWSSLDGFSQSSKTYRVILLEFWFHRLYVSSTYDLTSPEILMFPDIFKSWTKELHYVQPQRGTVAYRRPLDLEIDGFKQLRRIRMDWIENGTPYITIPGTQETVLYIKSSLGLGASHITEFDCRADYPTPMLISSIATTFPALRHLGLYPMDIWCGLCNTCSFVSFKEPLPTRIVYTDGLGLSAHYLRALAPLKHLRSVRICVPVFPWGRTSLGAGRGQNGSMWSGECDACMVLNYADEEFRADWVERKKTLVDSERPTSLEEVVWEFGCKHGFLPDGDETSSVDLQGEEGEEEFEEEDIEYGTVVSS